LPPGGWFREGDLKGSLIGLLVAGLLTVASANAQTFLGFRLLDLDGSFVKWSKVDGGRVSVSYAFVDRPVQFLDARNCEALIPIDDLLHKSNVSQTAFRNEVRAAFDMWERVANIAFREAAEAGTAEILIGAQRNPEGRAFADVRYRPGTGTFREIERSLICLNPTKPWKVGFDGNLDIYDLRYTVAHEIGHAIGLDHPEPSSQLMSHKYQEKFRTPQAGDVDGVTRIYGNRSASASSTR